MIIMLQNRKPVGGSCGGRGWLCKEVFGILQMVTWIDVSCWQEFSNLVAGSLNRGNESKLGLGVGAMQKRHAVNNFFVQVNMLFQWGCEVNGKIMVGFIKIRTWSGSVTWYVNALITGLSTFGFDRTANSCFSDIGNLKNNWKQTNKKTRTNRNKTSIFQNRKQWSCFLTNPTTCQHLQICRHSDQVKNSRTKSPACTNGGKAGITKDASTFGARQQREL